MFFGGPEIDLQIIIFLLGISLLASVSVLIFAKRKILSPVLFSILVNSIFFMAVLTSSDIFDAYNIVWLLYFSVFIWPVLNIVFIVWYASTGAKMKPKK